MWPIRLQPIHLCCQIISYPLRGLKKVVPKLVSLCKFSVKFGDCLSQPSGRAIHVPQISSFPAEMKGKWRGIFYVDISPSFPCGIPADISTWKFLSSCFPLIFKMQYNDIGRVPVVWKYPVMIRYHYLVN